MLISPLARKICAAQGKNPDELHGSGPRGRIMASDVVRGAVSRTLRPESGARNGAQLATPAAHPTREVKDGYYVYDAETDMSALASISFPIAVQCEKLLEKRYSLFDYIVRAVVKACTSEKEWTPGKVDVLLFEQQGEQTTALQDVADMSIYRIARESEGNPPAPRNFRPDIVICDAQTTRAQVAEKLSGNARPSFAMVVRGNTPKVGIRAGRTPLQSPMLSYTFYASATGVSAEAANRIAAELQALLFNPVRLLLLR